MDFKEALLDAGRDVSKLETVIEAHPLEIEPVLKLGTVFCDTQKFEDAISVMEKGLERVSYSELTWQTKFQLAVAYYYIMEFKKGCLLIQSIIDDGSVPESKLEFVKSQQNMFIEKIGYRPRKTDPDSSELQPFVLESKPIILVMDNFLENPDAHRRFALNQEYNVSGNYPGLRTKSFATDEQRLLFGKLLNKDITYWPGDYNGSFQYVTEDNKTWWHRDKTTYSALLYLHPDPISNSGTSIYVHKETGKTFDEKETQDALSNDSNNPDAWTLTDKVENHYNRLVIFSGLKTHRANGYFGTELDNARLFQIWFFS